MCVRSPERSSSFFDLPLNSPVAKIDTDGADRRAENLEAWAKVVRGEVSGSQIGKHLNALAVASQDAGGEPVRIVLISSFFYLGLTAGLVSVTLAGRKRTCRGV